MAPFIVLTTATLVARGLGALGAGCIDSWAKALAVGLAAMFALTASAHFLPRRRAGLIAIVPPRLGRPALLVTLTGVLEAAGAVGLLVPGTRSAAALCLAALMVVMFPANVHAARRPQGPDAPHTPLVPRTLLQIVFVSAALVAAGA